MGGRVIILFLSVIFSLKVFSAAQSDAQPNLENIPREKSEAINKEWEVVPGLKSMNPKKFKGYKTEIFHQSKDTTFVKRSRKKNQPVLHLENEDESQVVYNPNRKSIGSISGVIIINLKMFSDFESILKDYPLKKIRLEKELSLAIVKIKKGNDIAKIYADLKKDPRVKGIEVEIVPNNKPIAQ